MSTCIVYRDSSMCGEKATEVAYGLESEFVTELLSLLLLLLLLLLLFQNRHMTIYLSGKFHDKLFHATFTVNCISTCGNIYCTPQNHGPHNRLSVMCEMWGCDSGAAEYSSILVCYTVSFGVTFLTFQSIMVPLSSVTVCKFILLLWHKLQCCMNWCNHSNAAV